MTLIVLLAIGFHMLYGAPEYEIVRGGPVPGMTRDPHAEHRFAPTLEEWQFSLARSVGGGVNQVEMVTVVYRPVGDDAVGRTGVPVDNPWFVFLGGTGDVGDPAAAVRKMARWPALTYHPTGWSLESADGGLTDNPELAERGGRAGCSNYGDGSNIPYLDALDAGKLIVDGGCFWATEKSFGAVIATNPDLTSPTEFAVRMRAALERSG
jgi:hypothetical protein